MLEMFFLSCFLYISMHISLGLLSLGSAEADNGWREKNEWSFDCKLCQKYSHQKLLGSDNFFQVEIKNVADVFLRHIV